VDYECDRVEEFLGRQACLARQANADQPFFLYYNISPPHCPMSDAPEKYTTMYRPEEIPIRPNVDLSKRLPDQDHWFKVYRWDYRYYNFHLPYTDHLPEDFTLRQVIAEYYGMTTWVDDAVGRMLAALDANGLAEDTIVVFTSDHGDYLGSHGRVQKGDLHEESVRIPLIVRWPAGLGSGVASQQVSALVDLAPTLLDLAGAETPSHMAGQSLANVLRGRQSASADDYAIIETGCGVGIRTPTHLYSLPFVVGSRQLDETPDMLFDLSADPYQMHNLAGTDEQAVVARELERRLREWDARTPWMNESLDERKS